MNVPMDPKDFDKWMAEQFNKPGEEVGCEACGKINCELYSHPFTLQVLCAECLDQIKHLLEEV